MHEIKITVRDRLLRAWENSMELVRDFENYSKEITEDDRASELFGRLAEQEARHAAELLQMLHQYD